jgi:glycosyltransferase involved in cell wall biosynthesis
MPLPASGSPDADGAATRARVPANTEVLFGFAGRFVEEKGFDVLFDAIPLVMQEIPGAHFVFAGETNMAYEDFFGRSRERLERVQDHITFLGLLDENAMADFYAALDFIVIPSRSDCFNLVQAEAMQRGKPSIVADIPGARAMVQITGFGRTFEKENPQALAQQLIAAARERDSFADKYPNVVNFLDDARNTEHAARFIGG